MNIGKLRRGLNRVSRAAVQGRDNDFIRATCAGYLSRYLKKGHPMDEETMTFLCWIMGDQIGQVVDLFMSRLPDKARGSFQQRLSEAEDDPDDLPEVLEGIVRKIGNGSARKARLKQGEIITIKAETLRLRGISRIEHNLNLLAEAFSFNHTELQLVTFLFIVKGYDEAETYLIDHLKCDRFRSQNLLLTILDADSYEMAAALSRFYQIDIIDEPNDRFELTAWFLNLCQSPGGDSFTSKFYRSIPRTVLPITCHEIAQAKIQHLLRLLEKKSDLPKHMLLYGPPGTGKTSFAHALACKIKAPAYEIAWEDENQSKQRRAALTSCLKMTNSGPGSIIIVDEADNILNTKGSWFMRGETQDKGWLNRVMEEPGTRVIWITNSIGMIEESVIRRFAFSLHFKPFNRRQRMQLWRDILKRNQTKAAVNEGLIENLARKYKVNAGVIDMAVKTAVAANGTAGKGVVEAIELALEAYDSLQSREKRPGEIKIAEDAYSVEGLNIEGHVRELLGQLREFEKFLRLNPEKCMNMNLLFYGPPGTGKSALARHIADCLDREILCKRYSDLQSMYVGEGERNIRLAFEEAENEEAVLVVDEVDSMLFSRENAVRSWEISFTNEFLTQMEQFRGILICTTNRMTELDAASIRRFNRKIKFDYLTPVGNVAFYGKVLANLVGAPLDNKVKSKLQRISNLAPGDFKTVRDRFVFHSPGSLTHQILVDALLEESRIKDAHTQKRSIGF
jgi:SpoVK/Ycf46/Vps4 family AAA+-type ATPase